MKPTIKRDDKETIEKKEINAMYGTYTPGAGNTQTKLFFENQSTIRKKDNEDNFVKMFPVLSKKKRDYENEKAERFGVY